MGNHFGSENSLSHYKWQFSTGITLRSRSPNCGVTRSGSQKFPRWTWPSTGQIRYGSEDWGPLKSETPRLTWVTIAEAKLIEQLFWMLRGSSWIRLQNNSTCPSILGQNPNHHDDIQTLINGIPTSLKKICSSIGMMNFTIYGKIKFMFQTTSQLMNHLSSINDFPIH